MTPLGGTNPRQLKGLNVWVIKVPPGKVGQVMAMLVRNPEIAYVEPNYILRTKGTPNDPGFTQQPYLANIQAPQAWDIATGSSKVIVAVIDTGVDVTHPDLAAKIWKNPGETGLDAKGKDKATNGIDDDGDGYVDDVMGWSTVANNNQVQDDNGHGTHVAGIIAADTNNGQGIAGVSWGARIMPIKAMDSSGVGTFSQVAEGITFAADHGAKIINLSVGAPGTSQLLNDAVSYAQAHGALVVAAAGDSGTPGIYYPAALPNVIAVGATDINNVRASFSPTGDRLDLVAPGVDIYSTWMTGTYRLVSGTSASAAHVSGVAALLAGRPKFDTAAKVRAALLGSALDLGAKGKDPLYGNGLVQAYDALNYTPGVGRATPTPSPTLGPTPTPYSGKIGILSVNYLWAQTSQTVSSGTIVNAPNSLDGQFNNQFAAWTTQLGTPGGAWTFNNLQDTTITNFSGASVELRFSVSGWVDDQFAVQVYDGVKWSPVVTYTSAYPPPVVASTVAYNVYPALDTQTKVNAAQIRFIGAAVIGATDNITISVDGVRLAIEAPIPTPAVQPTPTLVPPPVTRTPIATDPHVSYTLTTDECAACHRSHTASGIEIRKTWPEQNLCFGCHTNGGSGTNVQPAFTSYTNTATSFFKHDISMNNGVHRVGENTGASFVGANRHVECEDCHEPHKATRTNATPAAPMLPPEQKMVEGVDPVWVASGPPSSFIWMNQAQREYQVCFKCHSSFSSLPTYQPDGYQETSNTAGQIVANGLGKLTSTDPLQVLDMRDLARAFNPYNTSFHPVIAKGRNTWAGGYVTGWGPNSMTYCSDCHTNAIPAQGTTGPHGSPRLHLLDGLFDYVTVMPNGNASYAAPNYQVCFKCHSYSTYVQGGSGGTQFSFHQYHNGGSGTFTTVCYACHNSHGSEQQHLINFDTTFVTPLPGYNSQTAWVPNGAGRGTCYLTCHTPGGGTVTHNGWSY